MTFNKASLLHILSQDFISAKIEKELQPYRLDGVTVNSEPNDVKRVRAQITFNRTYLIWKMALSAFLLLQRHVHGIIHLHL